MPRHSPYVITLSREERRILEERARQYTLPYFQVLRARIILFAAEGRANDEIAAALSLGRDVVSLWRNASSMNACPALTSVHARGGPEFFPPEVVVQVKALVLSLA